MSYPIISADSHITEAPDTYSRFIEPAFRDRAPYVEQTDDGVMFMIEGLPPLKLGLASAAGIPAAERKKAMMRFEDLHRGGYDSSVRLADQARDGVAAEVLYPTVGMVLCNHPDYDFKKACFDAYNQWIAEYCAVAPNRLLGVGQTAMRSPEEGIRDLEAMKALGLRGVMMPGVPAVEDYDSPAYDEFWEAAVEINLPIAFHIIATGGFDMSKVRGQKVNTFSTTLRGVQDLLGMLVFGGVFERHPKLRVVCVEGDAGWAPHFAHRMNRAYLEHRHYMLGQDLQKLPSEYFMEHLYFSFQDDPIAFRFAEAMNWRRLMWANDFPHSDATWPNSQKLLAEHTKWVTPEQRKAILCDNAAALYGVDVEELQGALAA